MRITAIKTHNITNMDTSLEKILDRYVKKIKECSVLVITSKIVSIAEGRIVPVESANKEDLVKREAELYIPASENAYGFSIAITHGLISPAAGIDESNGNGYYVLWPKDPWKSAQRARLYLKKRFGLSRIGVLITDSKTTPLRWGTTGVSLAYSGFAGLQDYIGTKDLFGREMRVTKKNVADGLAAAAVVVMGEGSEGTPLAMIEDIPFVSFKDAISPSKEQAKMKISIDEDVYGSILKKADWKQGGRA